jgi:hypothetical protein
MSCWSRQTTSTPPSVKRASIGPAAANTIGLWPARLRPSALSNATFAAPPVTLAWSSTRATVMGNKLMTGAPDGKGNLGILRRNPFFRVKRAQIAYAASRPGRVTALGCGAAGGADEGLAQGKADTVR